MQLYSSGSLHFLWLIAGIILLFVYHIRKRRETLARLVDLRLLPQLVSRHNAQAHLMKILCFLAAFIFLVLALARPQWGQEQKTVQRKGVDVIFLLDTSLSMLTEDVKPSRIAKGRLIIDSFVKKLKGDRVGLVLFSGTAFTAAPLTLDYSAFRLFLDGAGVGIVPEPGSNFKDAIAVALQSFPKGEKQHKALIILSDGEDNEGDVSSWVKRAKGEGVRIYTIGLGTAEGEPIPLRANKGKISGYKKDKSGEIVISRLGDKLMRQMAEETGGKYYQASPAETEIDLIYRHMQSLGKKEIQEKQVRMREDHFQIFVILALLLLLAEDLVRETGWRSGKTKTAALVALLVLWTLHSAFDLDPVAEKSKKAQDLYQKTKYEEALQTYRSEQVKHPENPELRYNIGTTLYKTKDFKEAEYQLGSALKDLRDPELRAKTYYNHGNALYRLGEFEGAIKAYQKALELNPQDLDAKYNLELLMRKNEAQNNKDEKKDEKDQSQQKPDQKEQKDQNDQNDQKEQKDQKDQKDQNDQKDQDQKQDQNQQQNKKDPQNNQDQKDQSQKDQSQGSKPNQSQGQGSDRDRQDQNQSPNDQENQQEQSQQDQQKQQDKNQPDQKTQQDQKDQSQQDQTDKSQSDPKDQKQSDQDQKDPQSQQDQQKSDQKDGGKEEDQKQQGQQEKQDQGGEQGDQKDQDQKSDQEQGSEPDKSQSGQEDKKEGAGEEKDGESEGKEPEKEKSEAEGDQGSQQEKSDKTQQEKAEEGKSEKDDSAEEISDKEQESQEPQKDGETPDKGEGEEKQQPEPSQGQEPKPAPQKTPEGLQKEPGREKGGEEGEESEGQGETRPSLSPVPGGLEPSQTPPPQLGQIALSAGDSEGEAGTQEGPGTEGAVAIGISEGPAKFQGEMSEEEALKILNALEGEEKQLLALRRPPRKPEPEREILKDW